MNRSLAPAWPTTVGTPYSRARIARCDRTLPVSATSPPRPGSSGRQAGIERAHDEHVAGGRRDRRADVHRAGAASTAGAPARVAARSATSGTTTPSSVRRNDAGSGGPAAAASRRSSDSEPPEETSAGQLVEPEAGDVERRGQDGAIGEAPAELGRDASGELVHPTDTQPEGLPDGRPVAGRGGCGRRGVGRVGTGGSRKGERGTDRRWREAEQDRVPGDQLGVVERGVLGAGGGEHAQCRRRGRGVIGVLVEQQTGQHLVAVQRGERRPGALQDPHQLVGPQRGELGHGPQLGVHDVDEVAGERRQGHAQASDPPGGAQAPGRGSRVEPRPHRTATWPSRRAGRGRRRPDPARR